MPHKNVIHQLIYGGMHNTCIAPLFFHDVTTISILKVKVFQGLDNEKKKEIEKKVALKKWALWALGLCAQIFSN